MQTIVYLDGDKLARVRRLSGLTQRQLAVKAGLSHGAIANLEQRGRSERFRPSTLTALAEALGVKPADLVSE